MTVGTDPIRQLNEIKVMIFCDSRDAKDKKTFSLDNAVPKLGFRVPENGMIMNSQDFAIQTPRESAAILRCRILEKYFATKISTLFLIVRKKNWFFETLRFRHANKFSNTQSSMKN